MSDHYSVLLSESVSALVVDPDGCYIDGTFGRGGHSRKILEQLSPAGRLIAFDKDPEAIRCGQLLADEDARFSIEHASFSELASVIERRGLSKKVAGVLLDLGVSSPQLDNEQRGFSFMHDGPLDMRMNNSAGMSAADWVNSAEEKDIAWVLKEYGEERFAKRIARAIVNERDINPFATTAHFAKVVSEANPKWEREKHPATRVFQAVRIYINRELDDLNEVLPQALSVLCGGGRLVVISFHSLEDRIVKRFIRDQARGESFPSRLPIPDQQLNRSLRAIGKVVRASDDELKENVRSRSAVMRVAEKLEAVEHV